MDETRFYSSRKSNNVPTVHGSKAKNNFLLPNGDSGSPIRIPVPPASRKKKNW
jgi:hypothetical protein